jgi:energy-coupling factor transporter ATP-binding protein EcfA2
MKIRAIRLREVGLFHEAIAVEGFSGGLDVLAGPNELGKSTLLKALERLFFSKHGSTAREIEALRAQGTGAPLIEADFEAQGRLWRLRKRFVTTKETVLTDVAAGTVTARGDDAHAAALELIGAEDDGRGGTGHVGLVWVRQKASLADVAPETTKGDALHRAIATEIEEAAGSGALRSVRTRAQAELDALLTKERKAPRDAYKAAIDRRRQLQERHAAALARADVAEHRLTELAALRARQAELTRPELAAAREAALADMGRKVEAARVARERRQLAAARAKAQTSRLQQLAAERDAIAGRVREREALDLALSEYKPALDKTLQQEAAVREEGTRLAERRQALADEMAAARRQQEACLAAEQATAARLRHAELSAQLAKAEAAARLRDDLARELAPMPASETLLREAEAASRAIAAHEARLAAAAPSIEIAYLKGGKTRILADGKPLADGARLEPTEPVTLEIPGVGRITVAPARDADAADAQRELAAHRAALGQALAAMGVADLAAARAFLAERHDKELRHRSAAAEVSVLARHGIERLARDVAEQAEAAAVALPADLPERAAVEARIADLDRSLSGLDRQLQEARERFMTAREASVRLGAQVEQEQQRRDALVTALAGADAPAHMARLGADVAEAETAAHAAIREEAAWADAAPADEAFAALAGEQHRLEHESREAAAALAGVKEALARIEGELARDREQDLQANVEEIGGELEAADMVVKRYEREADALELLLEVLDEAARGVHERRTRPLLARLGPYLEAVLPEARLALDGKLAATALVRAGTSEALERLSDGTREQIAVVTRLALGRLLAETGAPLPVILDDALVYSDDERLARLFGVLGRAAEHHQVIVLTCHARAFAGLGGTALEIAPWRVE